MDSLIYVTLAAIPIVFGGVVWGVRLEGKVNTAKEVSTTQHKAVIDRLVRIESKLDARNGTTA